MIPEIKLRKYFVLNMVVAMVLVAVMIAIPTYFVAAHVSLASNFSDVMTTATHGGEQYYILPDSKLNDTLVIIDKKGKKHYVLAEEKLRLLGPKLLTGEN